jgi:hypothetical protein
MRSEPPHGLHYWRLVENQAQKRKTPKVQKAPKKAVRTSRPVHTYPGALSGRIVSPFLSREKLDMKGRK